MLWPEGDHDAFWLHALRLCVGVKPTRAGEWLDAGEVDMVSAFASKTGLQQFVAPFRMTQRGSRSCDRGVQQGRRSMAEIS